MSSKNIFSNQTLKFWIFVAFLILGWYLSQIFKIDLESFRRILAHYPIFVSGSIFIILYVVITSVIWLGPRDVFRISAAMLFGAWISSILVFIAESICTAIMFLLSRFLGRDFVSQTFGKKMKKVDQMKEDTSGFLGVLALRINPLIPFRIMDLAYGLTKISFRKYMIICLLTTFPRIYGLQYVIEKVGEAIVKDPYFVASYLLGNPFVLLCGVYYILAVVLFSLAALILKAVRKFRNKRL